MANKITSSIGLHAPAIRLSGKDGMLRVAARGPAAVLEAHIAMTGETADPWAPGYAYVSARKLHEVSKDFTTEQVAVEYNAKGVTLQSGVASYRLNRLMMDEEDITLPKDENNAVLHVKAGQLASLFSTVCQGVNGTDPAHSVVLAVGRDYLVCQAMDRDRLVSALTLRAGTRDESEMQVVIAAAARPLLRGFGKDEEVELRLGKENLVLTGKRLTLSLNCLAEEPPRPPFRLHVRHPIEIRIPKRHLAAGLRRAARLTSPSSRVARFFFKKEPPRLTITTANKRGMSTETLEKGLVCSRWTSCASVLEVALNPKHLQAAMAPVRDVVRMGLGGPLEPVHIIGEGYGAAIMPVALSQASSGVPR
ncbi:MAG: hypothetical protein HYY96_08520 [Candidatus Tectomicrobia bacterium]|nr:hypothetical protein [Candidatus Tectomicrobia bacterium]